MTAWVAALRFLTARRLSEAQLRQKLARKQFAEDDINDAIERARRDRLLDDTLLASLYVETRTKALGNRRLVGDLVRRGVDREIAAGAVASAEVDEAERLARAYDKLRRTRPEISPPAAARSLERLGFPMPLVYRYLRERSAEFFELGPEGSEEA